jgi:KUP system potassium uptake protein
VLIDEEVTQENELPILDNMVLNAYGKMKFLAGRPEKWFGLDESMVTKELVPVIIKRSKDVKLTRIR